MIEALHQICTTSLSYRHLVLGLGRSHEFLYVQFGGSRFQLLCMCWMLGLTLVTAMHSINSQ